MTKEYLRKLRCAVYTRTSSEEGLGQEFNSIHAQGEAGLAYIASQKAEGWVALPRPYDDGGYSGGSLERPALRRLLADIEAGRIDVVVVYKIDRLTRSLMDFAKLVEIFDRHGVTFVAVTQSFNTTTSMGRLTLNILLSFAQFEREVASERIRDKFAASRRKGIWMGGNPPLGYDVKNRKLLVNDAEAQLVKRIFARFLQLGSALRVAEELEASGETTKAWVTQAGHRRHGGRFTKGAVYKLLNNRVYLGQAVHKGSAYPGEHEAIIDRKTWDKVQAVLAENLHARGNATRAQTPALLKGLIFGPSGRPMSPTHTRKRGRLYRYYVTAEANTRGYKTCPLGCVPAAEIEAAVIAQVRRLLCTPEIVARTWAQARRQSKAQIPERAVREALVAFEPLWDELFPAEQARLIRLLVERVDVAPDGITIRLRTTGLASLVGELRRAGPGRGQDAA